MAIGLQKLLPCRTELGCIDLIAIAGNTLQ